MIHKKVITFGEVMLRLSTPGFARFLQSQSFNITYAGAEANVAVSLSGFGMPAAHVTRFPDNDLGKAATQELKKFGVDTSYILHGDERLGVYFLENGAMQRSSKIIYDRFNSAFAHITKDSIDWNEIMKEASWFHYSGITPAISQGAADSCLEALKSARIHGVGISGDINYRRNLWQYGKSAEEVMPSLIEMTDIVIGGVTDMENCLGISKGSFAETCRQTMKQYPNIKKIVTTERISVSTSHNKISAVLFDGKNILESKTYDLTHIVDRVGSGDAFMAGLLYGMLSKKTDQQALEFATAACAWKHGIEGDVNLATVEEIENLVSGRNVGKLLR